jgi:hypothetical protein
VLTERSGQQSAMLVDYDLYAEGEALLGWLNATAHVRASTVFDGNAWLIALATKLQGKLSQRNIEIAHLKMTLIPDEGPDLASLSLTQTQGQPHPTDTLSSPLLEGILTVNLRAEADPQILDQLLRDALAASLLVTAHLEQINAFRPGRPNPTHRMAGASTLQG